MKLMFVGDLHADSKQPGGRIDDWAVTCVSKLKSLGKLSKEQNAQVIFLGDLFHTPRQDSHSFMGELFKVFTQDFYSIPYSIVGNHDIQYNNMGWLDRSAIGELFISGCLKQLEMVEMKHCILYGASFFNPYWVKQELPKTDKKRILVGHYYHHTMGASELVGKKELIADEVMNQFDYTFLGHDHTPYEAYSYGDGTLYRPGSLGRISADAGNINRNTPHVIMMELDDNDGYIQIWNETVPDIKPPEEVFTFESIAKHTDESYSDIVNFAKNFKKLMLGKKVDFKELMEQAFLENEEIDKDVRDNVRSIIITTISQLGGQV